MNSVAKGFRQKLEIGLPIYIFGWKFVYLDNLMCFKRWYKKYFGLAPPSGQNFEILFIRCLWITKTISLIVKHEKSKSFKIKFWFNFWRYWWANGFSFVIQCIERNHLIITCSIDDIIRDWNDQGSDQGQTSFAKWSSSKRPNLRRLQRMASCWNVLQSTSLASCPPTYVE